MIELNTFSAMELRRDGVDVRALLSQPKRLALLLYLRMAAPGGFITRERLVGLFWPEADGARGRNALRQSLHFLRKALGEEAVVSRGEREVGVDPSLLWCDAVAFDEGLVAGRPEEALELYRGDLLPGFYIDEAPDVERWLEDQRARYRMLAARTAWLLCERSQMAGETAAAVLWARRAVGIEPLDEAGVRRLMELLVETGARTAALEAFSELGRRLASEMELEPSPETRDLAQRIRMEATSAAAAPAPIRRRSRFVPASSEASTDLYSELAPRSAWEPDEGASTPATGDPDGSAGPIGLALAGRVRRRRLATAAAVLVLLAFTGWRVGALRVRATHSVQQPSIAVLPFVNMSGAIEHEYFSDGVTEELLNVLARVPGLKVAARTSSFAFKNKDIGIDSIARALRVTHVLEGSVRAAGDHVRITAQLIEAHTGYHLWSETYDREIDDIFVVQDEISRTIARKLQLELASNTWGASLGETRDPEAYRLLLRALAAFRTPSAKDYAEAAALLEEAIQRDPRYARAHGALANVLVWQAYRRYIPQDSAVYARADSLARHALRLRPVPEAHLALARLAEMHEWQPAVADEHFRKALELNPADSRALQYRAVSLIRSNRGEEAVAAARRATELDPLHHGPWVQYAIVLDALGRNAEALAALEQARLLSPEEPLVLGHLAGQYAKFERYDEAFASVNHALDHAPDYPWLQAVHAHVLLLSGERAAALQRFAELEADSAYPRYLLAHLHEGAGNDEQALALLEEAATRREQELANIRSESLFPRLRNNPRFVRLLEELGG